MKHALIAHRDPWPRHPGVGPARRSWQPCANGGQHIQHTPSRARGVVKAVNAKTGVIKIHHAPIPALKWPAMTMDFKAAPAVLAAAKVGKSVNFTLNAAGDQVTSLQ